MFGIWSPFLIPAIWQGWKSKCLYSRYLVFLTLAVFLVLSVIASKKGQYLLPIFPLWSLLVGSWLDRMNYKKNAKVMRLRKNIGIFLKWISAILIMSVWIVTAYTFYLNHSSILILLILIFLSLTATIALLLAIYHVNRKFYGLPMQVSGILIIMLIGNTILFPAMNIQHSVRIFAKHIPEKIPPNAILYGFQIQNYSLPFYANKKIIFLNENLPKTAKYVVTRADELKNLSKNNTPKKILLATKDFYPNEILSEKYNYILCYLPPLTIKTNP
ncbi:MAG: hypothetical protein U9O87_07040 [Verrucomicrobiota bacterium]|nr:hypothetical protein [Verrucomicrobiota bacterium]